MNPLEKVDDEIIAGEAVVRMARRKREAILSNAAAVEALSEDDLSRRMLSWEQKRYLTLKREVFGIPRKGDGEKPDSIKYAIFKIIYTLWITKKRLLEEGVVVDFDLLQKKTGLRNRQLRTYIAELQSKRHLIKRSGGKGQANKLRVVPGGYPYRTNSAGNFIRTADDDEYA
jgi:hypothetical protein